MSKRKLIFKILGLLCVAPAILTFINGDEIPSQRGGLAILGLILLFISMLFKKRDDKEQPNLINHQRNKIRIKDRASSLPITSHLWNQYGVMRRRLKRGGRRELGNLFVFGAPGRGKSSLLKSWLCNSDKLNFIVIDLKGELWQQTAGHRATLGKTYRLDLTSTKGQCLDALNTNNETRAMLALQSFLPSDTGTDSDYFNEQAAQIAVCYWRVARLSKQSALPILIQAATMPNEAMILFAKDLARLLPEEQEDSILESFENAFGLIWKEPNTSNGERNSVMQSFKGAFNKLNTREITSTISHTDIDIADLVEGRATLYISAPTTSPPYRVPIQLLLGGLILEINEYVDKKRQGKQGADIIILADEAGNLKIPMFSEVLATGRSRGLTMAAFLQTMGQLDQYHKRGWRGMVDTAHHWCWFNGNDPDAHNFLRGRCGKDQKGKYHFDTTLAKWKETEVMTLLDFDRIYAVFGPVINPYGHKATKAKMELEPPEQAEQKTSEPIKVFSTQQQEQEQAQEPEDRAHIIPMINEDANTDKANTDNQSNEDKNQGNQDDDKFDDLDDLDEFDDLEKVEKF